jgi:hypothetical protein
MLNNLYPCGCHIIQFCWTETCQCAMVMYTQLVTQQFFVLNCCLGMQELPPKEYFSAFGTVVFFSLKFRKWILV